MQRNNIMVDLETLGARPGCAILSIGAVRFDAEGISDDFSVIVKRGSCPKLFEDADTLLWWKKQSAEARQLLADCDGPNALELRAALIKFNSYIAKYQTADFTTVWGNGADFDNAILECAYAAVGIRKAWRFTNSRCYRTLKNLFPEIHFDRTGVHHNALDDAKSQAIHASKILAYIGHKK